MSSMNVVLTGALSRDPELRFTQSGKAVVSFTIPVTERWTDRESNEKRERTDWYKVTVWGKSAETHNKMLRKGSFVTVIADRVEARGYTKNDGEIGASCEITARKVDYVSNYGSQDGNSGSAGGNNTDDFAPPPRDMNDIPF